MAYDNSNRPVDPYKPPKVVYTRKNTTFQEWKEMVLAECKKHDIDPEVITPLSMLHGWETDGTPYSFTDIYVRRGIKERSRKI